MSKIIFMKNPRVIYECEFSQIGQNQIRLKFESDLPPKNTYLSGCCIVNEWNTSLIQTDRKDYKYLYREYEEAENIIELCNDNIQYVEPDPTPDPEPYIPTLDELKSKKIAELSAVCNQSITNGVDIDIDGETEHFSYNEKDDQKNIEELFNLVAKSNIPMYYHSDNNSCKLYTVEQIIALYVAATTNKLYHTTYFNQLKMYILHDVNSAETLESIVYGMELPENYTTVLNNAMTQGQMLVEALLQNGEAA